MKKKLLKSISEFDDWHNMASVRISPRHVLKKDEINSKLFFSPDIVPIYNHPKLIQKDIILVYYLCYSLSMTEGLEHEIVNNVLARIFQHGYNFDLDDHFYSEARHIYVDEAYHSLFSVDLLDQVVKETGISFAMPIESRYLKAILKVEEEVSQDSKKYVQLIFSIVSETLITGVLSKIPRDTRVIKTIRDVYRDHAKDEVKHHVYFSRLLAVIWPQLRKQTQNELASLFPRFIKIFLEPDYSTIKKWLTNVGLDESTSNTIISESYTKAYLKTTLINSSKDLLKYLNNLGVINSLNSEEILFK